MLTVPCLVACLCKRLQGDALETEAKLLCDQQLVEHRQKPRAITVKLDPDYPATAVRLLVSIRFGVWSLWP